MPKARFDYSFTYTKKVGRQKKFWQGSVSGTLVTISSGIVGAKARTISKKFNEPDVANKWFEDQVFKKQREGFEKSGQIQINRGKTSKSKNFSLPEKKGTITIKEAVSAIRLLEEYMNKVKNPDFTVLKVLSKPTPEELKEAELRLNIKFPPSYVQFIAEFGPFEIQSGDGHSYWRFIQPRRIEPLSSDLVGNFNGESFGGEKEYLARLKKLIPFQWLPYEGDDAALFDSARANEDGEMPVEAVTHEESYNPSKTFKTFAQHLYEICQEIGSKIK